ncbi:uncharacterized protein BDZ99DRAFT_518711 [Mytilinidion resinicola]|uniref:F-box domain-containing protein n=1 Tax=Mytilinidion resinicola TaxID=574789 RepID=A0A6A6YR90_9PEZI|nr:uncharacterized protein BDZ99DRAFT_518711 [Mytilinidion resinicola]KAF2811436.1 hypothetical protein BDZ99DRAFT_518711 [Mytilinidion resinicola]
MADTSLERESPNPIPILPCAYSPIPCGTHHKAWQSQPETSISILSKFKRSPSRWPSTAGCRKISNSNSCSTKQTIFSSLPVELIQHVSSFLSPSSSACLAVTSHFFYAALDGRAWSALAASKDSSELYSLLQLLQKDDPRYFHCARCCRLHRNIHTPKNCPPASNLGVTSIASQSADPSQALFTFSPRLPSHPRYSLLHTTIISLAHRQKRCIHALACTWSGALPASSLGLGNRGYEHVFYLHAFTPLFHPSGLLLRARHQITLPVGATGFSKSDIARIVKELGLAIDVPPTFLVAAIVCKLLHGENGEKPWCKRECLALWRHEWELEYEVKKVGGSGFEIVTWQRFVKEGWEGKRGLKGAGISEKIREWERAREREVGVKGQDAEARFDAVLRY